MTNIQTKRRLHLTFEITLFLKGFHAILETVGGILVFTASKAKIITFITSLTNKELGEDPRDFIAHYLITTINNLSLSSQHFIAFYLCSHGIIKLMLVIGLLQKKLWAYPGAIVIFSIFISYQLYRYSFTHSEWLLLVSLFDLAIIALTVNEYRFIRQTSKHS